MGKKYSQAEWEAAFWAKVDRSGGRNACWPWLGRLRGGYGLMLVARGKDRRAHRIAAFLSGMVESISAPKNEKGGGFVLHKCDNGKCCNPDHLEVGTKKKNSIDGFVRGRIKPPHPPKLRGDAHPRTKLSELHVLAVRQALRDGAGATALAKKYGVSKTLISLIGSGRMRAKMPDEFALCVKAEYNVNTIKTRQQTGRRSSTLEDVQCR